MEVDFRLDVRLPQAKLTYEPTKYVNKTIIFCIFFCKNNLIIFITARTIIIKM